MEPLDFGGAKQCQTIALLMGVAHPHSHWHIPPTHAPSRSRSTGDRRVRDSQNCFRLPFSTKLYPLNISSARPSRSALYHWALNRALLSCVLPVILNWFLTERTDRRSMMDPSKILMRFTNFSLSAIAVMNYLENDGEENTICLVCIH